MKYSGIFFINYNSSLKRFASGLTIFAAQSLRFVYLYTRQMNSNGNDKICDKTVHKMF